MGKIAKSFNLVAFSQHSNSDSNLLAAHQISFYVSKPPKSQKHHHL
tara:strand:- start:765 stop:902 length:138 start_codon:yes stop_codon:yes gene_type:complete